MHRTYTLHYLFYAVLVLILVFAGSWTSLYAQEDPGEVATQTPRERFQAIRENQQDVTASRTEAFQENTAGRRGHFASSSEVRKAALTDRAHDRVHNLFHNMQNRINSVIKRLRNVADRIESRAQKIAEQYGVNVGEALLFVNDARRELDVAENIINGQAADAVEEVLSSDRPRERFEGVRQKVREATTHIKAAHKALRDSILALKGAVGDTREEEHNDENAEGNHEHDTDEEHEHDEDESTSTSTDEAN